MAARTIRIFLAYAEEDYKFKDILVNQAKAAKLPVEFADMPAKQPWVPRWKAACRSRAFECDAAIVLVSRKTKQGVGVMWEVECICDTQMPVLVVFMEKCDKGAVPDELRDFPAIDYNWPEVGSFIQSGGGGKARKDSVAR
ncbi:MAG TPA: hypothetical protein VGH38_00835 [Bryobacteraceae bacterium]